MGFIQCEATLGVVSTYFPFSCRTSYAFRYVSKVHIVLLLGVLCQLVGAVQVSSPADHYPSSEEENVKSLRVNG